MTIDAPQVLSRFRLQEEVAAQDLRVWPPVAASALTLAAEVPIGAETPPADTETTPAETEPTPTETEPTPTDMTPPPPPPDQAGQDGTEPGLTGDDAPATAPRRARKRRAVRFRQRRDGVLEPKVPARLRKAVQREFNRQRRKARLGRVGLGKTCERNVTDSDCGASHFVFPRQGFYDPLSKQPVKLSPFEAARRLVGFLKNVRRVPQPGSRGRRREPLGVVVNFDMQLAGFRGAVTSVAWSLRDATSKPVVPTQWLRPRPIVWVKPKANSEGFTRNFWLPLPRVRGAFFVRLVAYDRDKQPRARAEKMFRATP